MQICELLLVAAGIPVWEACVCLTCKYFPALYASPTVSYVSYCVHHSTYVWLIVTSFYALVSYMQIFVHLWQDPSRGNLAEQMREQGATDTFNACSFNVYMKSHLSDVLIQFFNHLTLKNLMHHIASISQSSNQFWCSSYMTRCTRSYQSLCICCLFRGFCLLPRLSIGLMRSHTFIWLKFNYILLACLGHFVISLTWIQFIETITFVFTWRKKLSIVQYCKK